MSIVGIDLINKVTNIKFKKNTNLYSSRLKLATILDSSFRITLNASDMWKFSNTDRSL